MDLKLKIKIISIEGNIVHYMIPDESEDNEKKAVICFRNILKMKALFMPKHYGPSFIEDQKDESDDGHWVRIVIYSSHEFLSAKQQKSRDIESFPFSQELLWYRTGEELKQIYPIVHISDTDAYWKFMCDDVVTKLSDQIPRYIQIMDNSIWNYLIPLPDCNTEPNRFYNMLFESFRDIEDNYQNELYSAPVGLEYADLGARQSRESYLSGDGHAKYVSPFIFHSETAIEKLIENDKGCRKLKNGYGKNDKGVDKCQWRWRFLLVDDRAVEKDADNVPNSNCKMSIIKRLIERALFNKRQDKSICVQYREYINEEFTENDNLSDAIIVIDCVSSLDDAVKVLKNYKYDIVLLDYLLDGGPNRNYGYELLEEIDKVEILFEQFNDCKLEVLDNEKTILEQLKSSTQKADYQDLITFIENENNNLSKEKDINKIENTLKSERFKVGPRGRMFFIFISAYTTAVNERLLAQGLNRSESYWHIETGACPTNTPQLFTYNLLQLMDKRLYDSGILDLSIAEILKLAKDIFIPREMVADKSSVRERASEHYQDVLSLQYYYRKMLKDVEIPQGYKKGDHLFNIKESVLISHFMLENQHLDGLLEHLTELVHLTAFGTIRQWAEMWEEYLYIRAKLEEIDDGRQDFKAVCDYIEEYILNLKAQQR